MEIKKQLAQLLEASSLSPEEIQEAILKAEADKKKAEEIRTYQREYWKKIADLDNQEVKITFEEFKDLIARTYVNDNNRPMEIDQSNRSIMEFLFAYFYGYADQIHSLGCATPQIPGYNQEYRMNKGILIQGMPGTGKTSVLRAFRKNPVQPFAIESCLEISQKYAKEGYSGVEKYKHLIQSSSKPFGFEKLGWAFDDLGSERAVKHFGDTANLMEEILFIHSNKPDHYGKIQVSTNMSLADIEDAYGARIASRLKQMFNIIYYGPQAKDRRK